MQGRVAAGAADPEERPRFRARDALKERVRR
jgi:hypothetical protein